MRCDDCNHDEHKAGQCKNCNCGQSEITQLTGFRELTLLWPNFQSDSSLVLYGYDCGHRVPKKQTQ